MTETPTSRSEPVRVRPLHQNDRDQWDRTQSFLEPGDRWTMSRAGAEHLSRYRFVYLLVHPTDDETIVGFVAGRVLNVPHQEMVLGFKRLLVYPEFRRQGYASSLMERYRELDSQIPLIFPIRESNLTGQLFLKAQRFRWIKTQPKFYRRPSEACYLFRSEVS